MILILLLSDKHYIVTVTSPCHGSGYFNKPHHFLFLYLFVKPKELRTFKQGLLEPQLVDDLFTGQYGNLKVSNLQYLTIEEFLNSFSRNDPDPTLEIMLRGWIEINSLRQYFRQECELILRLCI